MVDHEMVTDHLIYFIVDRVFHVTIYHIRGKFDWMAVFDYHSPSISRSDDETGDGKMKRYHLPPSSRVYYHLISSTISSHFSHPISSPESVTS